MTRARLRSHEADGRKGARQADFAGCKNVFYRGHHERIVFRMCREFLEKIEDGSSDQSFPGPRRGFEPNLPL